MDVCVDEAGADEPAAALHLLLCAATELGCDGGDAAILDADVGGRLVRPALGEPYVSHYEIEIHRRPRRFAVRAHVAPCRLAFTARRARCGSEEADPWSMRYAAKRRSAASAKRPTHAARPRAGWPCSSRRASRRMTEPA